MVASRPLHEGGRPSLSEPWRARARLVRARGGREGASASDCAARDRAPARAWLAFRPDTPVIALPSWTRLCSCATTPCRARTSPREGQAGRARRRVPARRDEERGGESRGGARAEASQGANGQGAAPRAAPRAAAGGPGARGRPAGARSEGDRRGKRDRFKRTTLAASSVVRAAAALVSLADRRPAALARRRPTAGTSRRGFRSWGKTLVAAAV